MYDIILLAFLRIKTNLCVSRIFLEIAWRMMNCSQAAHEICVVFGFLERNRVAARP